MKTEKECEEYVLEVKKHRAVSVRSPILRAAQVAAGVKKFSSTQKYVEFLILKDLGGYKGVFNALQGKVETNESH